MIQRVLSEVWRLAWPLLVAVSISYHYRSLWPLCLYLVAFLGWQIRQELRLARWLEQGDLLNPPHARGLWERYYTRLMHLFRTEQQTQEKLTNILNRIRHSADNFDEALLLLTPDYRLAYYNNAASSLLGLMQIDRGELLTNLLRHPKVHQYLKHEDFSEPLTIPAAWKKNILRLHITSLAQEGFLLRVADVTHIYNLEAIRSDFVANVSHELKTPITVFKGSLEILQDNADCLGEQYQSLLNNMQQQSERMESLVVSLLLLARLEGQKAPAKERFSLTGLCQKIHTTMQAKASKKQQDLQWEIEPELAFFGVSDEIESAFSNLIDNALHYSPAAGTIQVNCRVQGSQLIFSVQDNGPGIEPQHIPHLTERFYRVDKSRVRASGGTGLGLAIVKHVLQRHNGELKIVSQPGQGSLFSCVFDLPNEKIAAA